MREKVESSAYTWHKSSGLIVHDFRRSAVRNLRLAGVSESEMMKITGHKTATVFRRYNIVTPDDVSAAMRKLETASLKNVVHISVKLGKIRSCGKSNSTQLVVSRSAGA